MAEENRRLVAYLEDLYEDSRGNKMVVVRWFHKIDEVGIVLPPDFNDREIFFSLCLQDLSVECIDGLATILGPQHFEKFMNEATHTLWEPYLCHRQIDNDDVKPFDITQVQGYWSQRVLRYMYTSSPSNTRKPLPSNNLVHEVEEDGKRVRLKRKQGWKNEILDLRHKGDARETALGTEKFNALAISNRAERCVPNGGSAVCLKKKEVSMQKPQHRFSAGTVVEVLSQDSGIRGCWFRAVILKRHEHKVKVRYQDIKDAEETSNLEEWILASRVTNPDELGLRFCGRTIVRPYPPPKPRGSVSFDVGTSVDAWWHDGWWEGIVVCNESENKIHVYFQGEHQTSVFSLENLRQSQDWVCGQWNCVKDRADLVSTILSKQDGCPRGEKSSGTSPPNQQLDRGMKQPASTTHLDSLVPSSSPDSTLCKSSPRNNAMTEKKEVEVPNLAKDYSLSNLRWNSSSKKRRRGIGKSSSKRHCEGSSSSSREDGESPEHPRPRPRPRSLRQGFPATNADVASDRAFPLRCRRQLESQMRESKDGTEGVKTGRAMPPSKTSSVSSLPLILDMEDFKGEFSFDALFGNLVNELLPSFQDEDVDSSEGVQDGIPNGHLRGPSETTKPGQGPTSPLFPEADALLSLFKDSCRELVDLRHQVDARLGNLKRDVSLQDTKHRKTLAELEKGVDGLFDSFARLDSRISSVGQTAAKIGDHLQSADSQRETANQTIELIKYLMEFNSSPGDLMELSPLFSDDNRVAEAAAVAQKLRSFAEEDIGKNGMAMASVVGTANASRGLEVAVANLQDYCNELENRLLARFDAASQRRELSTMAECAKILSQFNRGTSAMQRYVASRLMFIDVEMMNADTRMVLGDQGLQASPSSIARGLAALYREITETVRKEAATIMAVFPSPDDVMSILVQRVLEQRVTAVLDKLLIKPSLVNLPPIEEGGLLLYLRILAVAYEKTQELAKELRSVGCGDLDVEGLTESLFLVHKDEYPEHEQASLRQLYQAKMEELRAGMQQQPDSTGSISRSKVASVSPSHQQISVAAVTEFVRWNEEAVSRCTLLSSQPTSLASNVRAVFTCLLDQVSQYTTEGLERTREGLNEAAALRERFMIGTSLSRRVAAAAASAAEAAAAAGESGFRSFMVAVQRATSNVAIVQQYFANSISRLLLPVDGAHAASCEEMAAAMSSAEGAALKGLQQCIDTVMAEVERLLSAEQKATDYRSPDDGNAPDHRPTNACIRVVAYLSHVLDGAYTALEGLNKQAFMTELGNRLHKGLLNHWQKFTFSPSGGLRLKRDITEYGEFVRSFNAPAVDEKFELLGIMANVFIVAPESLASLFEGSPGIRKDALRFIQLREDFKTAKIASRLNALSLDS